MESHLIGRRNDRSALQLPLWNLSRCSFTKGCLKTVVSKMGLEIEVAFYERQGGVLLKVTEILLNAQDVPLSEIFTEALPEKFEEAMKDPDTVIRCFAGSIQGEEISMKLRPKEVDYVIDALRNETRPVLLLCRDSLNESSSSPFLDDDVPLGRTASGMVKDFMDIPPNIPKFCKSSPSLESPSSPPTPGSAASENVFSSDSEDEHKQKAFQPSSPQITRKIKQKHSHTLNRGVPLELYEYQQEFIFCGEENSEVGAENGPLQTQKEAARTRIRDKYKTIGPAKRVLFEPKKVDQCRSLPRNKPSIRHRFSKLMPLKSRSLDTEITQPSSKLADSSGSQWKRRSAVRRKRRTSSSVGGPVIPESSYAFQIQTVRVNTEERVLEVSCRELSIVGELKEEVAKQLNKQNPHCHNKWRGSDLILTYQIEGKEYELFNDWQFIYKTALYDTWARLQSEIPLTMRPVSNSNNSTNLSIIYRVSKLAGVVMDDRVNSLLPGADTSDLKRIAAADQKEVQWARRTLHSFVDCVASTRDEEEYALSMELDHSGTSTILALKIPYDNKVEISFHYKQYFSLTKKIGVQRYADSVLAEIFPCVVACGLVEDRMDGHTMQISGEMSFIAGRNELLVFKDIRRCIIKGEPIHISITEKPSVQQDRPCKLDWLPIDPYSGEPPLHTDITRTAQRDCQVQALSIWDYEEDFMLRIVLSMGLPLVQVKSLSQRPNAVVEATLYHGEKPLCPTVTTEPHPLDQTIRWKETLNFKIAKKNIPKAAKIMFEVREPLQRRESLSAKKGPKFLFWGLTTIYDHQGMLHNGERTMSLWKGKKDADEYFTPNPSGPASNNPDPKAVTLTIKFDSYGFPVYYPSSAPQSWSLLLRQLESTNVTVRKQFQRLLDMIREGKLHSAVPAYIEKVNWGSLSESLEVYSLLDQIADARESFPVETALKLLDCDFPDENVREFATRVLEVLTDEQLEDFILQLTQALKFELDHDSELAKFLLKRALRNKRIGHFFFWYLKCEMYNSQYTTRFGVILEAYLKGCGEAMLKKFEDQLEMQMKLEEIGRELKQRCNDDHGKMQAMLPELLDSHGVPCFTLTPVYNPRILLGNLRPTKCRIMASKKKPQWLEMYNVDPTCLRHTPTRLILKMGDDLRQDMITLRMLSLFEKLWEQEGLDLELIPYGCMATGPNTGFIEVVKNAKTIAEVSGVSNSIKLYEWIKSHQKNEFGEIDPDKVRAAVKTFIHSCAGYSVATYVLGIGDRHNDNIMVTTSGNLFHIDFGHFLGNIKYCMGFKREWAPFVLTPDFVYVMGGEDSGTFEMYKNLCCRAFLTLRRHADLIINLFSIMRSTGIPELTCVEDTDYIRNALVLDKNEHDAEQMFRKVIKKCLDLKWTVQIMWKFHLWKKGSS